MKLSDYIVSYLEERGVRIVFGYIGGMITHLTDSIALNPNVKFIQTYHEQTAAIAAEGYAKESNLFGVSISTSGPGATNMITGIADAYFDSIPVLYITGQVNSYEYKYDKPIRQQGFQETDVVEIVKPITKYAKLLDNASEIKYELDKAIHIALSGRKGPVLLDIPMDIQRADIDPDLLNSYTVCDKPDDSNIDWDLVCSNISKAKRPLVLIGAGCHDVKSEVLMDFISKYNLPFVTSLMGKGIITETCDNYLGLIGSYGNRCANMGIANADLLIVLGSRLDTRQTGARIEGFLKNGNIIHVDIDKNELDNHRLDNRTKVHCSVGLFIDEIKKRLTDIHDISSWSDYIGTLKNKYNQTQEVLRFVQNKVPYNFMQMLNEITECNDIICADIGQNQMWAAQCLTMKEGQRFVTSGGLAPMGFSMPAAIGCAFASPNKNIYSINGDGGFHMAIQSLMLISQYNLPIKVVVINNSSLGMITQFQHLYFEDRMTATTKDGGYIVPNIKLLSEVYGLPYIKVDETNLTDSDVKESIQSNRNCIIELIVDGLTDVCPKLEYNKPISQPTPQLPEQEFLENMLNMIS